MSARAAGLLIGAAVLLAAPWVRAHIPPSERIANAVAEMNRKARRSAPLALEVALDLGDTGKDAAKGSLLSDPSGRARLALRSPRGTEERHLQQAGVLLVTREGDPVESPRPFLPPLFLLQALDAPTLMRFMGDLGIPTGSVVLGYDGESNCFVFGRRGPTTAVPGAVWVDQETLEIVRVDLPDGRRFRLGPGKQFGSVRLPAWIDLQQGDRRLGRLRIERAARVKVPAGSFDPRWLEGGSR